ncbi:MAG: (d)CMP kinase [Acidimicrobiia bacterium]|nr:MAG: (d)CMP kinase [Acidimicrobiia bacterium]
MVIAIDGPSGVGKSTVSRSVARQLGLGYLDTGATYRAATLAMVQAGIDITSEQAILDELTHHSIDYSEKGIVLDGKSVAFDVRSDEVTRNVSALSAHPRVRNAIVKMQRSWVDDRGGEVVVEGRDIGTVVFPEAPVKIYLTASALVRATRRSRDAEASDKSIEEIAAEIEARDHADSTRRASPLRPAVDALVIDTSDLTITEVVDRISEAATLV